MRTIRVGVVMGIPSIEREVSFDSGRTICDHLDTIRYSVTPLFQRYDGVLFILPWHFLHRGKIADFEHRLESEARAIAWDDVKELIDFVYIAAHGRYAEDGCLQGLLEVLGIPYLGSGVFTSALCMNKKMQKFFLQDAGIDTPKGIALTASQAQQCNAAQSDALLHDLHNLGITFPLMVKPEHEGSSLGISVVFSPHELASAIYKACHIDARCPQGVLIEERIEGMEFSCITLIDKTTGHLLPLPPTEIEREANTSIFDYTQKYMPGRAIKHTPARCSQETIERIHQVCRATIEALDITVMARIDGFVTPEGRIVIIDPNTLAGMGPTSFIFREAAEIGMGHAALINHLIETALLKYTTLLSPVLSCQDQGTTMSHPKKMRIAVLMGGNSNEREISLVSGRNVTYKLSPHRYEAIPIFVNEQMELFVLSQTQLVRNSTKEIAAIVQDTQKIRWHDLPTYADFVFIALHGGHGENGNVQGIIEMLRLPYNGSSVLTSALCMDKYRTNRFLRHRGFHVPRHVFLSHALWYEGTHTGESIAQAIGMPAIVKPHDDGCSVLVTKVHTAHELTEAINILFTHNKSAALVEEYIEGMELTVGVVGNEHPHALPPSQVVVARDILSMEEKFLPGAGENQTPAALPTPSIALIQRTMEHVYKTVGCSGYARIDCFYQSATQSPTGHDRVIILEINSLPALTPATCIFHQAAELGIQPMNFIDNIIQLGCEQHAHVMHHEERTHNAPLTPPTVTT